jgi:predicted DNA-binding transcriptional regulator AlpA
MAKQLQEALERKNEAVASRAADQHERAAETRERPSRSRRTPRSVSTQTARAPPADGMPQRGYFECWRVPQVLKVYGKSRASLYAEVKAGTFPAPFKNGEATVFDSREVLAEMEQRKTQSRANPPPKKIIKRKAQPATTTASPRRTTPRPSTTRAPARRPARRSK